MVFSETICRNTLKKYAILLLIVPSLYYTEIVSVVGECGLIAVDPIPSLRTTPLIALGLPAFQQQSIYLFEMLIS